MTTETDASIRGSAIRGAAAVGCVASAAYADSAAALLSVLGDDEVLVTLVDVSSERTSDRHTAFRGDLVDVLGAQRQDRRGVPVLALPFTARPEGVPWSLPGENGLIEWTSTGCEGTALVMAVAHPDGKRWVAQFVLGERGGLLLHDVMQTVFHIAEKLDVHPSPALAFRDMPVPEIRPLDDGLEDQQRRTFARARRLLPPTPDETPPAERLHLIDELIQSVLRDPDEHSRMSRLVRMYRPPADEVLHSRHGGIALALVVAELCVEILFPVTSADAGPRERADLDRLRALLFDDVEPIDVFTDALTTFLLHQVTNHAQTADRVVPGRQPQARVPADGRPAASAPRSASTGRPLLHRR